MKGKRKELLEQLAEQLGIAFKDLRLLHQALIHSSFANEHRYHYNNQHLPPGPGTCVEHNERLEFLGDAVLELVISEYLFRKFPDYPEGELTKLRAVIVCEPTLARRAAHIRLGQYLLLGKGEETSGGRERISILADTFEALIGAIYLDGGLASAERFILNELRDELALVERGQHMKDYKTSLQEVVQRKTDSKVTYEVVEEFGPDHDKVFVVAAKVNGHVHGTGSGKSKKEAEQNAAKQALSQLKEL